MESPKSWGGGNTTCAARSAAAPPVSTRNRGRIHRELQPHLEVVRPFEARREKAAKGRNHGRKERQHQRVELERSNADHYVGASLGAIATCAHAMHTIDRMRQREPPLRARARTLSMTVKTRPMRPPSAAPDAEREGKREGNVHSGWSMSGRIRCSRSAIAYA